jgi:aquaporin Z
MKNWQKYAAEAFGTFVLVGIGAGVVMASGGGDPFAAAFGFGFAWLVALYTIGRISGGHLNPVLTLAAFLDRAISARDMVVYWVAQFVGAIGALGIFAWLFSGDSTAAAANGYGQLNAFKAFSVEAILTLILTAAFLTLLRSEVYTKYLGMGFTLLAVTLFGFGVTTAGMNPARTLAPAIFSGEWSGIWVYFVGPIVGAIAGWVLYRLIVRGDTRFTADLGEIKESVS